MGAVCTTCEGYLGQTLSLPVQVLCKAILQKLPGYAVFIVHICFEL